MRALVMGDGIAGQGAAIVLARAGWQVTGAAARAGKPATHRCHAHLTSAAVIAELERAVGGPLGGWAMGDAAVWDDSGRLDTADRPILAAEALRHSLAARAAAAGVRWYAGCTVTPVPAAKVWRWRAEDHGGEADLVVDATGSGHWLGRMEGIAVTIEELAGTDRCWSWTGVNDGPPQPWLIAARAGWPDPPHPAPGGRDGSVRLPSIRARCAMIARSPGALWSAPRRLCRARGGEPDGLYRAHRAAPLGQGQGAAAARHG